MKMDIREDLSGICCEDAGLNDGFIRTLTAFGEVTPYQQYEDALNALSHADFRILFNSRCIQGEVL
jgi:hypothetical protein